MCGRYSIREIKKGKTTLIFTFIKTVYGKDVLIECKSKRNTRSALIYTNCNDLKKFGVRLNENLDYGKGGTLSNERWQGGNCVGFNFSYRKAREIAINYYR